ncbi:MAG: gas vesicle protein GvpG [Candidatus Zhuqueibacterota bacterium]
MAIFIDDLLALPVKGLFGIFKEIHKAVDQELNNVTYWQRKLLEAQIQLETNEIDMEQYVILEEQIVSRISEIQGRHS